MNRTLARFGITLLLIIAPACGSTKPPAPAAVEGNRIIAALKDLSSAYEKKNLQAFSRTISENFRERQAFLSSIESVFSKYETLRFTIHYTNMFIMVQQKGPTKATFNWDSEWRTAGGTVQKDGGRVTFLFDPADARLDSIDGKNPFLPQAAGKNPLKQ